MGIDNIDKQIINALYKKGRENLINLGEKVFKSDKEIMSHAGVRKRIKKLEDSEILKVQGNINTNTLKYKMCIILLAMKNYDEVKKIINAYSLCPRVFLLTQITGRYNLLIGIIGQNIEVLHRYINYCGPTNKEGILHSEILFVSSLETPEYLPLNLFSKKSHEAECGNICKNCEAYLDGKCDGCGNF
ncbi:MAG: Lrp/AsnC family transcriptional regulator [Candidatus Hermodarchaeota archaeon]